MALHTVTPEQVLASEDPSRLDEDNDGSCACYTIDGDGFVLEAHCWRACRVCAYSGVHVTGTIPATVQVEMGRHAINKSLWAGDTEWALVIGVARED